MAICNDNNNNNNSNNNNNVDGWPSTGEGTRIRLQLMVYPRSPEPNQQSLFGGSEGQSFHYGSLSAAVDRQSSQLGRPLRNVFLPAPSQSVRNLYRSTPQSFVNSMWIFNLRPFFPFYAILTAHTRNSLLYVVVILLKIMFLTRLILFYFKIRIKPSSILLFLIVLDSLWLFE